MNEQAQAINEAINESVDWDRNVDITIQGVDIIDAMSGIDYDDAVQLDGIVYDVWGVTDDGEDWRLSVTLEVPGNG